MNQPQQWGATGREVLCSLDFDAAAGTSMHSCPWARLQRSTQPLLTPAAA